jgi:tetratricopeptide (TPR) repeat protein
MEPLRSVLESSPPDRSAIDLGAIATWVSNLMLAHTGQRLSELQRTILENVWQGRKYPEIAAQYGCTEGHAKDVGSDLWKALSLCLGEKVTKINCRRVLELHWQGGRSEPAAAVIPGFMGREGAIAQLNHLVAQGARAIVIQGEGGIGKTTLAQHYLRTHPCQTHPFDIVLELLMAKESQTITPVERVVEEWLQQDFGIEPGSDFGVSLARLKRQLHSHRVGILIDNLEPALDGQGRFIASHRHYVELLRILSDPTVQSLTVLTSRDRLCEASLSLSHYRLPGLSLTAWQQFFQQRGMAINTTNLAAMHQAYGGNAKALGLLCGSIQEDYQADLDTYWNDHKTDLLMPTDLSDLVTSQINRLQTLDPPAYQLFCRLGCYRYQDFPTVPMEAVSALLWDVPRDRHRSLLTSLRHRSLIETQDGEYAMHPVIRAAAIARLRSSPDWPTANAKAAHHWTTSIPTIQTTQDALRALEAYYHWVAIDDFAAAGQVILHSRLNQWQQFLPLGSTLYRMGLLQPVFSAITQVLSHYPHPSLPPRLIELQNILGDLHWIRGNLTAAIACQQHTIALATSALATLTSSSLADSSSDKHQHYTLTMLHVDALLSLGLYQIDLWELDAAAQQFQQVIAQASHTAHHPWAEKATVCLALVHSYQGQQESAKAWADSCCPTLLNPQSAEQSGRLAYFIQLLGQTYLNLGQWETAQDLLTRSLQFAQAAHYTQIQARALTGFAELHRHQGHYNQALTQHHAAIARLEELGATCDLATAYLQRSLTYQAMGEVEQGEGDRQTALHLFHAMQATRQIERLTQR